MDQGVGLFPENQLVNMQIEAIRLATAICWYLLDASSAELMIGVRVTVLFPPFSMAAFLTWLILPCVPKFSGSSTTC